MESHAVEKRTIMAATLGSFLSALSVSVVGVIMPILREWAGVSTAGSQWIVQVSVLTVCVGLLPSGRMAERLGYKTVYLWGVGLAVVASLTCGLAPNYLVLLVGRAIQGLGGAMTMTTAPALVSLAAAPERKGRALGTVSAALYAGLTVGPPFGGFLNHWFGFRGVFLAQAGMASGLLVVVYRLMPRVGPRLGKGARHDFPGLVLQGVVVTLALALATGISHLTGNRIALLAAAEVVLVAVLVRAELRSPSPLLEMRLFRSRTFTSATVAAFLNYVAVFHGSFLVPFYLRDSLHMGTRVMGIVMMCMPLAMALAARPSGVLSDRLGSTIPAASGLAAVSVGLFTLSQLTARLSAPLVAALLMLIGLGAGTFAAPNTSALLSSAPRTRQGSSAAVMALARNLGMMMGTASAAYIYHHTRPLQGMDAAFGRAWLVGSAVACLGILAVVLRRRSSGSHHATGGGGTPKAAV